jgi:hypothetical protein
MSKSKRKPSDDSVAKTDAVVDADTNVSSDRWSSPTHEAVPPMVSEVDIESDSDESESERDESEDQSQRVPVWSAPSSGARRIVGYVDTQTFRTLARIYHQQSGDQRSDDELRRDGAFAYDAYARFLPKGYPFHLHRNAHD